jgi:hypothetical protein
VTETLTREEAVVRTRDEAQVDDDQLDGVAFAPAYERALSASERRSLYAAAMAPLWRQIQDDPAAVSAASKLRERVMTDIEAIRPHDVIRSAGSSWSFDIPPGTSVFTPPYDYARSGPSQGEKVTLTPDPVHGTILVWVLGDTDYDGALGGSAAVGLGLEFRAQGLASVRPYVEYDALLGAHGSLLSSHVEGHLGFAVSADDGTVASTTQDFQVGSSDDGWDDEVGALRPPYQEVQFLAEAHRRYRVWVWATVTGDQSGDHTISGSWINGRITANVKFVTVEIH